MKSPNLSSEEQEQWTEIIEPGNSLFALNLASVWRYRDLLMLFVKRDFISTYKQTILGPLWFFIAPIFTTITFTIIFGRVAQISTEGIPPVLFYMSGIIGWNYFSTCLTNTSTTFRDNAGIFGKVYFPRLIIPLSTIITNLIKFSIQFLMFIGFWLFFIYKDASITPNSYVLLTPLLIVLMAGLGLGFGMIISSFTTKYKDLVFLLQFGVQLLMYATPIIYPLSTIPEKYKWIIIANPMTSVIETFRYAFLGSGTFNLSHLIYSLGFMIILLFLGIVIFNKTEKTFIDTV